MEYIQFGRKIQNELINQKFTETFDVVFYKSTGSGSFTASRLATGMALNLCPVSQKVWNGREYSFKVTSRDLNLQRFTGISYLNLQSKRYKTMCSAINYPQNHEHDHLCFLLSRFKQLYNRRVAVQSNVSFSNILHMTTRSSR